MITAPVDLTLRLESPGFRHGEQLPVECTVDGAGVPPVLRWTGGPQDAREYAVIAHDPDAPRAFGFVHWVVRGIPGSCRQLSFDDRCGWSEGLNSRGETGWRPASPPQGHGRHHYYFHLYALDRDTASLGPATTAGQLTEEITGHVIAQARIVGTYQRSEAVSTP